MALFFGSYDLGSMGKDASRFAPALAQGMSNTISRRTKIATAKALWRIQGSANAALYVLDGITNALVSAPTPVVVTGLVTRSTPAMDLCLAAQELMQIPEFRAAAKPHLCNLTNNLDRNVAVMASKRLDQIQRLDSGRATE